MALQSRPGHKSRKKAHFTKIKLARKMLSNMHPHQIKLSKSRLERSAPALQITQITSRTNGRKRRRHSQYRRAFIESRPCVISSQIHGGTDQISESSPVSRMHSKKGGRSVFLFSPSSNLCCFHEYGVDSKYVGSGDAASTSTSSFCSRLGRGRHISHSGPSDCGQQSHFELCSTGDPVGICSLASHSNLTTASCLPFPVSEFSAATAGVHVTPGPSISPINLILDSSPDANEILCASGANGLQEIDECRSPFFLSIGEAANLKDHSVTGVVTSASSSSTLGLLQGESMSHHKNYESALSFSPEISTIPSSPKLTFQQILKDHSCGLSPLIEAETSRCEMFQFVSLREESGMLENLLEKELGLPLLWGYLDRSYTTGISEPHRHSIVIWQIQHASKYKFQLDTLFTAVNLLDRFLFSGTVANRQMLWLLGVACMCIAVKIEETQFSSIIPVMQDICTKTTGQKPCFTKKQLIRMETVVLHTINYECSRPTSVTFIWHYLDDYKQDREMQILALTVLCLSLTDYEVLHFPASVVAASSVCLACLVLKKVPPPAVVKNLTGYADNAMRNCVKRLDFLFAEASGTPRHTSDL